MDILHTQSRTAFPEGGLDDHLVVEELEALCTHDKRWVAVQSVKPALRRLAFSDKAAAWMPLSNSDKLSATAAST
jgi:hypothetical protein